MIENADRKILVMWVIAAAMLTKREIDEGEFMPRPNIYAGSAMVYGVAAVLAEFAPDLAFWLAFGWTLQIAYQMLTTREGGPQPVTAAPGPARVPAIASRKGA